MYFKPVAPIFDRAEILHIPLVLVTIKYKLPCPQDRGLPFSLKGFDQ